MPFLRLLMIHNAVGSFILLEPLMTVFVENKLFQSADLAKNFFMFSKCDNSVLLSH